MFVCFWIFDMLTDRVNYTVSQSSVQFGYWLLPGQAASYENSNSDVQNILFPEAAHEWNFQIV